MPIKSKKNLHIEIRSSKRIHFALDSSDHKAYLQALPSHMDLGIFINDELNPALKWQIGVKKQ